MVSANIHIYQGTRDKIARCVLFVNESLKLVKTKNTTIFAYRRTLLSPPPKQIVSLGSYSFTTLFGMGRGGAYMSKTPTHKNSGAKVIT